MKVATAMHKTLIGESIIAIAVAYKPRPAKREGRTPMQQTTDQSHEATKQEKVFPWNSRNGDPYSHLPLAFLLFQIARTAIASRASAHRASLSQ